jgi:hypothetical protein
MPAAASAEECVHELVMSSNEHQSQSTLQVAVMEGDIDPKDEFQPEVSKKEHQNRLASLVLPTVPSVFLLPAFGIPSSRRLPFPLLLVSRMIDML